MDRSTNLGSIIYMVKSNKNKLPARVLTGATVLLLILAGTPFFNMNTNGVNAASNPYSSPSISNLANSGPTSSGSFIFWDTNITSNNRVYYGLNESDVNNLVNGSWSMWDYNTINVNIRLSGLSANTTYYYKPESWYFSAANDSVPANVLVTLKPGVWTSPSEYMVSPPGWTGSPVNFRTINISAAILDNASGRYVQGLSLEAVIYNSTGGEIGGTNMSGAGPYSGSFILPDYLDEGGYVVRITGYPNISGEFSVLRWGCANCHNDNGRTDGKANYPSTFDAGVAHSHHFDTTNITDLNVIHCGDDMCSFQTQYFSTQQCTNCHVARYPTWVIHPQAGACSDCHRAPSGGTAALVCENCHGDITTTDSYLSPRYGQDRHYQNATCNDCHGTLNSLTTKPNCTTCHPRPGSILSNTTIPDSIENTSHSLGQTVSCGLCHNREHDVKSLQTLDITVCRSCHPGITHNGGAQCTTCHGSNPHRITFAGGPDCITCHDVGKSAQHIINNTAMDTGVHVGINRNATNGTGISSENKKCWACHQSDGQQPTGMGDRFNNPYKCYDCHNGTAPYSNVSNAPTVSNHFKSGNSIKAWGTALDNNSSCVACHNTSEMKVTYTGDNLGTNFSLPSHYGMKRIDLMGLTQTAYCLYCHNSSVENVTFGMSDFNNSIVNHSGRVTTPQCADCHDTIKESLARLHNGTLTKPVSNDTLCKNCHGPGGNASTNNKVEHKNLYCTECHANGTVGTLAGKDIHGIKYLTQNNTFSVVNTSAVNCVTCHQTSIIDSSLGVFTPPKISSSGALHHSNNVLNGTVWGNYWTPGTNTACIYCHSDTKHNATPLGRPLQWLGSSYQLYGAIGTNSTCADCHYKGAHNYSTMQSVFTSSGLGIPPEITNGSWNGLGGYFNHSLTTYLDRDCNICHGWLLSPGANMSGFLHNVASLPTSQNTGVSVYQNIGMYDTRLDQYKETLCRNCHNSTFMGGVPTRHHNLLSENQINPTTGQVFGCMDCHPIISNPSGQSVLLDRNCIDCHNGTAFWGNSFGAAVSITRPHHINTSYDDTNIGIPAANRTCSICHGSFVADYNDGHYIPLYNTTFSSTPYATAKAQNITSGKLWGGCEACHQSNSGASPAIFSNFDTHHGEILGFGVGHQSDSTPGVKCNWCHVTVPGGNPYFFGFNLVGSGVLALGIEVRNSTFEQSDVAAGFIEPGTTNVTFNGTACEKCHSVESLHSIQFNYSGTNGLPGYGHIGNNSDCDGCHASDVAGATLVQRAFVAGAAPMQGAIIPSVDSIYPSVLTAGVASTLTITGVNFVNNAYSSVVSVDGVAYTPTSITDTQIVVSIPALTAGVHKIQLVKGDTLSKLSALTVVSQVNITSARLKTGLITITGTEFGTVPSKYITITSAANGNIYFVLPSSWSNTLIQANSSNATKGDTITVITATGEASAGIT